MGEFRPIREGWPGFLTRGGLNVGESLCGYLKTYPIPISEKNEQNEMVNIFGRLENKRESVIKDVREVLFGARTAS